MNWKRSSDIDSSTSVAKKSPIKEKYTFSWDNDCFSCGEPANIKKKKPLSAVTASISIDKCLNAAKIRGGQDVLNRLQSKPNLSELKAKYHRLSYLVYVAQRNLETFGPKEEETRVTVHEKVANSMFDDHSEELRNGGVLFLSEMCKSYRKKLAQEGYTKNEIDNVTVSFMKSHLLQVCGDGFDFFPKEGKPDIVCSRNVVSDNINELKYDYLYHRMNSEMIENTASSPQQNTVRGIVDLTDNEILHRAACILQKCLGDIAKNDHYPTPLEVSTRKSAEFVRKPLRDFLIWLLDKTACVTAQTQTTENKFRRAIILAECVIFSSNSNVHREVPPFHYGLMIKIHHDYGSRSLIELLNSYELCANHTALRSFLTSAAKSEIETSRTTYSPSNIVSRDEGGSLVQEADDNVDINAETIDGKNTYHGMARVLFQRQFRQSGANFFKIPKELATSLDSKKFGLEFQLLPFNKPNGRSEPPRIKGLVEIIRNQLDLKLRLNKKDALWVVSRGFSRGNFLTNEVKIQIIPSWKPFQALFCEKNNAFTVVSFMPTIDAQPSDMATVYITLKKGHQTALACGQKHHIHTMDQQLYTISQIVKFAFPSEFPGYVGRMGGFHASAVYMDCVNKIWGETVLDIVVESGVYAGNTAKLMLEGEEFNRAVRGFTLLFEV
ncbi:hypothetical protein QAD02_020572 [Eretmocerus hayati]|uniref:Uncharacterized protein n=1 Tax=Eretmocerus hayati TaxID=131215 RepID=A0ACC2PNA7_9HYME|nr:hypothetical protein QAD02_020572 [Eretmocerus hayati]